VPLREWQTCPSVVSGRKEQVGHVSDTDLWLGAGGGGGGYNQGGY